MKIGKLLAITLGVLSFICAIAIETSPAKTEFSDKIQGQTANISTPALVSQAQPVGDFAEERAERLYAAGQFKQAIELLQQINTDYAAAGDVLGQARILRNLALVYHESGDWAKANNAIIDSLNYVQRLSNTKETQNILAQILEVKGLLQLAVNRPEQALETWKQSANLYQELGDINKTIASQINQAQALQRLGLYRDAIKTLNLVNDILDRQPDTLLKVKGLQSLGNALRVAGELEECQKVLTKSLAIAEKLSAQDSIASIYLSLGNTARGQQKLEAALDYYQRATRISSSQNIQIQAQVNQLSLLVEQKKWSEALAIVPALQAKLTQLPLGRTAIDARINLASSLIEIDKYGQLRSFKSLDIAELLVTASQQAESIGDKRSLAYSLGNLGRLYEQQRQWKYARELTEQALNLSQSIQSADIAYKWQWQLGRLLKQQGDRKNAIAAYTETVNTLQSIRSDLVAISSEAQFSFQGSVEPIYRELVELLLPVGEEVEQSDLKKARDAIEALQLAELDNFFQDACLKTRPVQIDEIDPKAAVFYTIILSDRLEAIVALPGQPLRRYTTVLPKQEIEAIPKQARDALTIPRLQIARRNFLTPSQKIYDWLIRPIDSELAKNGIETLVFVLDGGLRNIPMTALYDGEKYLVQKYAIAISPGLQLVDAKALQRGKIEVLTAGLSEARQGFTPLPGVEFELENISDEVKTTKLFNQSFTTDKFKEKVTSSSFRVIHLATHGQFSSKAKDTFILTWDDRIKAKDLDILLRADARVNRPIELLVLSACQTAVGDNRAVLGLTGVAVRAGARSTIASLWNVNDEATTLLMSRFYEELAKSQLTKAEALRRAEQAILEQAKFSHPYFWAGFVLVGNWL